MQTATYNGWTNYETWCVNLWIDNEEGSYRYWREVAQETWDAAEADDIFSREERAVYDLSERLKSEFEEGAPELGASVWSDLMSAALSEVNWREIAEHMIEDTDRTADEEPSDNEE